MKALIFQTMLALLIPGLSNTPKQALTPPTTFDYSYKLQGNYQEAIWQYKNESTGLYSIPYFTRVSNGAFYNYKLEEYPIGGGELYISMTFNQPQNPFYNIGGNFYTPLYNNIGNFPSDTPSQIRMFYNFYNVSHFNYLVYFDNSSQTASLPGYSAYGPIETTLTMSVNFRNNALNVLLVPAFSSVSLWTYNNLSRLDAIYFKRLPITMEMSSYGLDNYYEGYNEGYTTAYDEFGNFDWLSSLFTTMGDLLAIEILPGITIGLILLIPIVFGVLRFIMGLFR